MLRHSITGIAGLGYSTGPLGGSTQLGLDTRTAWLLRYCLVATRLDYSTGLLRLVLILGYSAFAYLARIRVLENILIRVFEYLKLLLL